MAGPDELSFEFTKTVSDLNFRRRCISSLKDEDLVFIYIVTFTPRNKGTCLIKLCKITLKDMVPTHFIYTSKSKVDFAS